MTVAECIQHLIGPSISQPVVPIASAFAPANIALVKYWGKRDVALNLPVTSSLSISLGEEGSATTVSVADGNADQVTLNSCKVNNSTEFAQRLVTYLDAFRPHKHFYFNIETTSTLPIAAGLASSASGYAALVLALNQFFGWQLDKRRLSILARLGSGSASRSLWPGFVYWQAGDRADGLDCHAAPIDVVWPDLRVGLIIVCDAQKPLSSRLAMQRSQQTSPFYAAWPEQVKTDTQSMQQAIEGQDFQRLGEVAEHNALAMHAILATARPPIVLSQPSTLAIMHQVWALRKEGVSVYFTQDAGPNIKLLFLKQNLRVVRRVFKDMRVVLPFSN